MKVKNAEIVDGKKKRRRNLNDIGFEESVNVRNPVNHINGENDCTMKVMERATAFFAKERYCDFTQFKEVRYIVLL